MALDSAISQLVVGVVALRPLRPRRAGGRSNYRRPAAEPCAPLCAARWLAARAVPPRRAISSQFLDMPGARKVRKGAYSPLPEAGVSRYKTASAVPDALPRERSGVEQPTHEMHTRPGPGHHQFPLDSLRSFRRRGRFRPEGVPPDLPAPRLGR